MFVHSIVDIWFTEKDLFEINVYACVIKKYHPDNHHNPLLQYRKQIARFSSAIYSHSKELFRY